MGTVQGGQGSIKGSEASAVVAGEGYQVCVGYLFVAEYACFGQVQIRYGVWPEFVALE